MRIETPILKDDFASAGEASSKVKKTLTMLGVNPKHIKRISVAMYEAEINAFIHGGGGMAYTEIFPDHVDILIEDHGKGIADLNLAMQEGYSTASDEVRMMGFGAGMGLPNMKRNSDDMVIVSSPGKGTRVKMRFNIE
ncbi:MAG: ATP-binding protein [Firmicutes bacterium]|nr:ATP-binding protein [Bacillota bacterium]